MVQGTASGVGKSWLCTALCRLFARRGLRVAPFKAQNLSNNAAPARAPWGWGEIGRAQAVQAEAAGIVPSVDHNPILVKPERGGAQVVLGGRVLGTIPPLSWSGERVRFREAVAEAYARVAATADVVVLEGAGSPAEINIADDLANMGAARIADARVLLVGDIDRGGVFASLLGTLDLLRPEDRARVAGLVVNRFRGDPAILRPGLAPLEARAGVPVLGVLPWRAELSVDDEDAEAIGSARGGEVDVVVLKLPTVSNSTDLGALARHPGVTVRWEDTPGRVGNPDLLVLPGAKDTVSDLRWLRARGLDRVVVAAAARGIPVLGLCGGYQLLGARVGEDAGLGLLPVATDFADEKRVAPAGGTTAGGWLLPAGLPVEGYEIHQGRTRAGAVPLVELDGVPDGAVVGLVAGTYLHGLLDGAPVRDALVAALRGRRGLDPTAATHEETAAARGLRFDTMADLVEAHLTLDGVV